MLTNGVEAARPPGAPGAAAGESSSLVCTSATLAGAGTGPLATATAAGLDGGSL